jgi:DNA-binding LytR/AlgR family response regulator
LHSLDKRNYNQSIEGGGSLKVSLETVPCAEPEIIIRCEQIDAEISALLSYISSQQQRLPVSKDGVITFLLPADILYAECVENAVFVYSATEVYQTRLSLATIAENFAGCGYFRCSKSMIVNLHGVTTLKCCSNGRILATLSNHEQLLISRFYARQLRDKLKGGYSL